MKTPSGSGLWGKVLIVLLLILLAVIRHLYPDKADTERCYGGARQEATLTC